MTPARSVLGTQAPSAAIWRFPVPPLSFSSTRRTSRLAPASVRVRAGPESGGKLRGPRGLEQCGGLPRTHPCGPGSASRLNREHWAGVPSPGRTPGGEPAFRRVACPRQLPELSDEALEAGVGPLGQMQVKGRSIKLVSLPDSVSSFKIIIPRHGLDHYLFCFLRL